MPPRSYSQKNNTRSRASGRGEVADRTGAVGATSMSLAGWSLSRFYFQPRPTRNTLLVERLPQIARKHPRYGYRRACAVVRRDVVVNHKRVYRLWKPPGLGLKRRVRQRRRGTGTMPVPARYPGHVWTYDFMHEACMNGQQRKLLTVVDECTREALAIEVGTTLSPGTSRRSSVDYSGSTAHHSFCGAIMGQNSLRSSCGHGWRSRQSARCTSSRDVPGRMATGKVSMAGSETSV